MPYPYTPPPFLQNQTADVIHKRMLEALPPNIDKSELQIPWDFTRPAAMEKAEFVQFELNETVKIMFPHWSYDNWLNLHAQLEGLVRRPANPASGDLTVIGQPGTIVVKGFQFATAANLNPSVIYESMEEVTLGNGSLILMDTSIPTPMAVIELSLNKPSPKPLMISIVQNNENPNVSELQLLDSTSVLERFVFDNAGDQVSALMSAFAVSGSKYFTLTQLADSTQPLAAMENVVIGNIIPAQAIEGGIIGNVPADTVMLMVKPDTGINYVSNQLPMTGGAEAEDDESLRERVLDAIRHGISWTGCDADYVRWAKEVPGVGNAVTDAEWDDPNMPEHFHYTDYYGQRRCAGAVRLFVIDAQGLPANQQILDAVYDYIINRTDRMERRAPIGATLTVAAPAPLYIDVSATVTLKEGENLDTVLKRFKENLNHYWLEAASENDLYDVYNGIAKNTVKYVYVGSTLAETAGISNYDHNTLLVNNSVDDIEISVGEFPVTGVVNLSE